MAAVQGAPVQDVVMEDAVSEVVDEGQVMRNELQELFRVFHLDGAKTVSDFVKESNDGRWPTTYETMKDAVSRYHRFLESMVLSQVDEELGLKKYSEVTQNGIGEVSHEVTAMAWLRDHIPQSQANHHTFAKMQGGDWFKAVCIEDIPRQNARGQYVGMNSVAFLNVSQYGGRGTTSCTETRVSQDYMSQILRRTAGRDAALCFTSTQLNGQVSPVEIQVTADGVRVPPVPMAKAVAKPVAKPKAKVKAVAKPVPKVKAMRYGNVIAPKFAMKAMRFVRVPMKAMKVAMKARKVPMK